jgi:hypothetical protein
MKDKCESVRQAIKQSYLLYCLVYIVFLAASCEAEKENIIEIKKQKGFLKSKTKFSIAYSDTVRLGDDELPPVLYESKKDLLLYFYDAKKECLQVLDVKNEQYHKEISLPISRPPFFKGVLGVFVQNPDSIFLYMPDRSDVALVDSTGSLISRWKLRRKIEKEFPDIGGVESFTEDSEPFYYDAKTQEIVMRTFPNYDSGLEGEFYAEPYKLAYSIKDSTFRRFGNFPVHFQDRDYAFSNDDFVHEASFLGDTVWVSFHREPTMYQYSKTTGQLWPVFSAPSVYLLDELPAMPKGDLEAYRNHVMTVGRYGNIYYDEDKKVLIRHISHSGPRRGSTTASIQRIDLAKKEAVEYKVPTSSEGWPKYSALSFMTKDGLLLFYLPEDVENENTVYLELFDVD